MDKHLDGIKSSTLFRTKLPDDAFFIANQRNNISITDEQVSRYRIQCSFYSVVKKSVASAHF